MRGRTLIYLSLALLNPAVAMEPQGDPASPPASRPRVEAAPAAQPSPRRDKALERPAPGSEPRIRFEETEHRFGEVEAGSVSTATFAFVNEGPGPLRIFQARPSCGCVLTSIEAGGKPYALGDPIGASVKGSIGVAMTASWRAGEKHTVVDVLTNDPALGPTSEAPFGHVKLHVYGRIVRPIELFTPEGEPCPDGRLDFGRFLFDAPPKRSIHLRPMGRETFEVIDVKPTDPRFHVSFRAREGASREWEIEVSPAKDLPLGPFLWPLTIETRPPVPGIVLFLAGEVRGALTVEPGMLLGLRMPRPRDPSKRPAAKLTIRSDGPPIQFTNVRFAEPTDFKPAEGRFVPMGPEPPRAAPRAITDHLTLETALSNDRRTATLEVRVEPTMPDGFFHTILYFETGVPRGPEVLAIPVTGFGFPGVSK